jgi:hypothetical protein
MSVRVEEGEQGTYGLEFLGRCAFLGFGRVLRESIWVGLQGYPKARREQESPNHGERQRTFFLVGISNICLGCIA